MLKKNHDKLPTLYLLSKFNKRPYKANFITHSSTCTTTEHSVYLTACLMIIFTVIKKHIVQYCETLYVKSGKMSFGDVDLF